jgi:4-hydroxy-tetrahydrodipicolinate synthase
MQLKLEGVFPPHITPFSENEEIDTAALRDLTHFWLDSGCAGLVSCASNGEGACLDRGDRQKVLQVVLDETKSETLIIAGVGAPSTRETIAQSRDAKDVGAHALLVTTPYYYRPNSKELIEHYTRVAGSVDLPIIFYNVPKFTGYNVEAEVMAKLIMEHDQIVAVKDSSGSIGQISDLIRRIGGKGCVLAGTADVLLPSLHLGAKGGILAIANVAPKLCVDLYGAFLQKDFERARTLQMRLLELNEILVKKFNQISAIKEAMNILGKKVGVPRRPSLPVDVNARNEIENKLLTLQVQ